MKKLFAIFMSVLMIACFMPTMAFADDGGEETATEPKVVEVDTLTELQTALENAADANSGDTTISITENINLGENDTWTSVYVDGYNGAGVVTIHGNGHTITGLNDQLFSDGFGGECGLVIDRLTLDKVKITDNTDGKTGVGAFIGNVDSMPKVSLTDCHLVNSTITSNTGSRVGGLIGYTTGYNVKNNGPVDTYITVTNCSVKNTEITAKGSVGALIGHAGANAATYHKISNCTVEDTTLESTKGSTEKPSDWCVGVAVGTANVGQVTISDITESGNTLVQTNLTAPEGQSNLYGRLVANNTGVLIIDGEIVGGSKADNYVAEVNGRCYSTLEAAVQAATEGDTVTLLKNVTITQTITIEGKDITLALNEKTITGNKVRAIHVKSGNLELTGRGTVTSTEVENSSSSVIRVGDKSGTATFTMGEDVTVEAPCTYGVTVFGEGSEEVTINGKIEAEGQAALSGNGAKEFMAEGTTNKITIGKTAVLKSKNGAAIYQPQKGSLTINGGRLEGNTAIIVKSGEITIAGGDIKATGEKNDFVHNGGGFNLTGDALVIEACDYPGGLPLVSISGGTFTSDKAQAIAYYQQDEKYDIANKKFISGGTFSSDPTKYLAEGYRTVQNAGNWTVVKKSHSSGSYTPGKSALEKAKEEAIAALNAAASANKYDEAEQAEVKKLLDKATADIKAAKTEAEVKTIKEAAQPEIEKVLTSEENAQIKAVTGVDKEIFKAKSKLSKLNGKKAIKVTWNVPGNMKLDGYEVFRSTKRYSGFGTEPYFTTSKTSYKNNKELKTGKTYYYKVRGFVEINGVKYYTQFSTKAFRTVK